MPEKYTRLFLTKNNLYTETSPVIITAHALLKDNTTEDMVAQLKISNISNKTIKAVKVKFTTYDTAHRELDSDIEYEYLDRTVTRTSHFGSQTPIVFENKAVRYFDVIVAEVVFSDNFIWTCPENAQWAPLAEPQDLFQYFTSKPYLVEKYRKFHNCKDLEYFPARDRDLWICSCGEINHADEESCYNCENKLTDLENVDINTLEQIKVDFNVNYSTPLEKLKLFITEKKGLTAAIAVCILIFLLFMISSAMPSAEEKRAELIEANFIGQTFKNKEEKESGNLYKTITYNTIDFESESAVNTTVLVESYKREKKYGYWTGYYYTDWEQWLDDLENSTTATDWYVTVLESGEVTVTIHETTFDVSVDENDMPESLENPDWGTLFVSS